MRSECSSSTRATSTCSRTSSTAAERRRRGGRRAACLLLLLLATPVSARLLQSEGVLDSQAALPPDTRRLEFGSSYFGAPVWAGHRHSLRYAGSRGNRLGWSLCLPWVYSSLGNGGRAGRDNLLIGGGLRLAGSGAAGLRATGDFWLPFAARELAPLAERRAFGRLGLIVERRDRLEFATALSYCWELVGIVPEAEGGAWPKRWELALRSGLLPAAGWGGFLTGGLIWQPADDEELRLGSAGGGVSLGWGARWRAELACEACIGASEARDRADYRLRLVLRRDSTLPPPDGVPEAAQGGSPGSEPPRAGP